MQSRKKFVSAVLVFFLLFTLMSGTFLSVTIYSSDVIDFEQKAHMNTLRGWYPASATLHDGSILVLGGRPDNTNVHTSVEIYDVHTDSWNDAAAMNTPRWANSPKAATLIDGRVLVAGGFIVRPGTAGTDIVEIYDPLEDQWSVAAPMNTARGYHVTTVLADGRVLVAGGQVDSTKHNSAEIYDPLTDTWELVASMNQIRTAANATTLKDGRVLVVGGDDENSVRTKTCEIYCPVNDEWTYVADIPFPKIAMSLVTLSDGRVMMLGGNSGAVGSMAGDQDTYFYFPDTDEWVRGPDMPESRSRGTAALIDENRILLMGGGDNVTNFLGTATLATFNTATYTVTFIDWDGTVLKTETVAHSREATAPENPVRIGYELVGWDADFSNVTEDLTVTAIYEYVFPGARAVFGGLGGTELFLGGNYIELGISNWGDFGTEGNKPDNFRGTLDGEITPFSGSNKIGMSADHDGFNYGRDLPVDYYLPGTPEERFVVGYKTGGITDANSNMALGWARNMPTTVRNDSDTDKGLLKATIVSTWQDIMEITQVVSFHEDAKFYRTEVTLKNLTDQVWEGARYMRTFDPDNTQFRGGRFDTANTVTYTIAEDGKAVVKAETHRDDDPMYLATGSRMPFFFYSTDPAARASVFGFANTDPYKSEAYDNPQPKGATIIDDVAITITWDSGTLAPGKSKSFIFYSSLDERDFSEVEDDIARGEKPTPTVPNNADDGAIPVGYSIIVDGEVKTDVAQIKTETSSGGQTVATVTIDEAKLKTALAALPADSTTVIQIPVSNAADIVRGELNGQMVKDMEGRSVILEIITQNATYTLPAKEINIDTISAQVGENVKLSDILVQIEIAKPAEAMARLVEDAANKGNFILQVPPVTFKITCTYRDKTVSVSRFNSYVARTVAIPAGVDPSRITTGVVVDPDGTVRHVPTKVIIIDGKYYAQINSLTNSTYSVIWNPLEFKDTEKHWAKEDINNMGSRLVVGGVGDDIFEPDRDITRGEFAAIIVRALGLKPAVNQAAFSDVRTTDWFGSHVATAVEYNLVSGYGDGSFGPSDKITREQALAITARAMKITGLEVKLTAAEEDKLLAVYSDAGSAAHYAKGNIAACIESGIVAGRAANLLAPKENITRAEVAVIIKRLLQKSGLI